MFNNGDVYNEFLAMPVERYQIYVKNIDKKRITVGHLGWPLKCVKCYKNLGAVRRLRKPNDLIFYGHLIEKRIAYLLYKNEGICIEYGRRKSAHRLLN